MALQHFQGLDSSIGLSDLQGLVKINILKEEEYTFSIVSDLEKDVISNDEMAVLECSVGNILNIDVLKNNRKFKLDKLSVSKIINSLKEKNIIVCSETRYDFKNTKISTGLFGVNRVFLPSSNIFPTLVASDSNDFVATEDIDATNAEEYKTKFLEEIYKKGKYRKVTKEEACLIQGFPEDFLLPPTRARWMKLVGNSVSAPVIEILGKAIIDTGIFDNQYETIDTEASLSYAI